MNYNITCMCDLDYESTLNAHKKEYNKHYIEDQFKKEFTKAMEWPGGYFQAWRLHNRQTKHQGSTQKW